MNQMWSSFQAKALLDAADRCNLARPLIGQPSPCSPEIERPSAARPSKIPGERIEKPTPAGASALVSADSDFADVPGLPHTLPDAAGVAELQERLGR
jgi:hypothetical protein